MNSGTITDLCNLKFFTDTGTEVHTQQQYTITWKLDSNHTRLNTVPEGFILGDIEKVEHLARTADGSDFEYYRLKPDSLIIGFTTPPEIILSAREYKSMDRLPLLESIHNVLCSTKDGKPSKIIITIDTGDNSYSTEIPTNQFFEQLSYSWKVKAVYTGDNDDIENYEYKNIISITGAQLTLCDDRSLPDNMKYCLWDELDPQSNYTKPVDRTYPNDYHPYLYYLLEPGERAAFRDDPKNTLSREKHYAKTDPYDAIEPVKIRGIAKLFPFLKYSGALLQETISAGFTAANTIVVLEEVSTQDPDNPDNILTTYERPAFKEGDKWSLAFECPEYGELKIIETSTEYELIQKTGCSFLLGEGTSVYADSNYVRPFVFTIGVIAPDEGCYQNYLGIYMRLEPDPDYTFFMGMLVVKTEVIQEDTRYRTLLENFGIPDPKTYPTLFAEANYDEDLPDYELINRKSKELMLTYDQIFPYAGTYKALINALKFLGYQDILIKEWYKIFDNNGLERDVAFDSIDIQNGKLGEMLDKYQTSETRKYTKLDYLTIVYHLNQVIEETHPEAEEVWNYAPDSDMVCDRNNPAYQYFDVSGTEPIYAYRTDEITAKLYALKKWLETYILGVSCRIVSITGEGVYFAPMKTQIYSNSGMVQDFQTDAHMTPAIIGHTPFIQSESEITCTLREFDNLTFDDMADRTFSAYTQENYKSLQDISYNLTGSLNYITGETHTINHKVDFPIVLSNPCQAPVLGDEYQFELQIAPESMSLSPWMPEQAGSIFIEDDVIRLSGLDTASFFLPEVDKTGNRLNKLPYFIIETGNLRFPKGVWEKNVDWMIQERIDNDTLESVYLLQNIGSFAYAAPVVKSISHIILKPVSTESECQYSCENKWGVPVFMIKGYKFDLSEYSDADNIMSDEEITKWFDIPEDQWFILEIVNGRMMQSDTIDGADNMSYELMFGTTYDQMNQNFRHEIKPVVTYTGERIPIKIFNQTSYDTTISMLDRLVTTSGLTYSISTYDVINFIIENLRFSGLDRYYLDYIDTKKQDFDAIKEKGEWLLRRELLKREQLLVSETLNVMYSKMTINKTVDIPVHHLGTYTATCKMYDRYNNIYVNKASKSHTISALPYSISLTLNQENSSNPPEFYHDNIAGSLVEQMEQRAMMIDGRKVFYNTISHRALNNALPVSMFEIRYPKYYDLYDIQNNTIDYNNLYFWNYSYANLVPTAGDQILLSNRCTRVYPKVLPLHPTIEDLHVVALNDWSAQQQLMFHPGDQIMIFKYNQELADMESMAIDDIQGSDHIIGTIHELVPDDSDKYADDLKKWPFTEKFIEIIAPDLNQFIIRTSLIPNIRYYMINISRYEISVDSISSKNDYMDSFLIPGHPGIQHFQKGNVVTVNYLVKEHPYNEFTLNYGGTKYLHNALYDGGYPSLYIKYDNGYVQEHQYCKIRVDSPLNIDVKLENSVDNMQYALLVWYQYDPECWKVFELSNYILKSIQHDVFKWAAAKDLIFETHDFVSEGEPNIQYSSTAIFDKYDNKVTFRFPGTESKTVVNNSVSYRVTGISERKTMVMNRGMLPEYTYTLNGSLDTTLINYYLETGVHDVTVTVSYPYSEFTQYTANVTETGSESIQNFGAYNYSMIRTDFLYDADSMMLDSYIDQQFIGRIYEFDPAYLKRIWVTKSTSLTVLDDSKIIPMYKYTDYPITIKAGTEVILRPEYPEKTSDDPFKEVKENIWSWEANLYDDSDYLEHTQDNRFRHHTVFKCLNKVVPIKPDTYGVNDVILTCYDGYGNKLEKRSEALVYIQ